MPHEYTRQRQGRDFFAPLQEAQNRPADEDAKKTLDVLLEQSKKDIQRNAVPIDGKEPKGRGLA